MGEAFVVVAGTSKGVWMEDPGVIHLVYGFLGHAALGAVLSPTSSFRLQYGTMWRPKRRASLARVQTRRKVAWIP